jgi:glutaredoxin
MGQRTCPHCDDVMDPAFIAADESLVALELEMTVFNVEREEHAARIARKEIGQRLENIPLDVVEIETIEDDDEEDEETEADDEVPVETEETVDEVTAEVEISDESEGEDDDVLPEFEELIDE